MIAITCELSVNCERIVQYCLCMNRNAFIQISRPFVSYLNVYYKLFYLIYDSNFRTLMHGSKYMSFQMDLFMIVIITFTIDLVIVYPVNSIMMFSQML